MAYLPLALPSAPNSQLTPQRAAVLASVFRSAVGLGELRHACAPVRTSESCVSRSNSSFVWIFDRGSVDGVQALDEEPGGVPSGASGQLAVPATMHV